MLGRPVLLKGEGGERSQLLLDDSSTFEGPKLYGFGRITVQSEQVGSTESRSQSGVSATLAAVLLSLNRARKGVVEVRRTLAPTKRYCRPESD